MVVNYPLFGVSLTTLIALRHCGSRERIMLNRQSSIRRGVASGSCLAVALLFLLASGTAPTKRPGFVDVSPRSKFNYISNNSTGGHKYFPQPMCGGVAIFDFDNDGKMDIFFTNGAQLPDMYLLA